MSTILERIESCRAVAILRTDDQDRARKALAAVIRGGFRCLEVTLTTPGAIDLIAELAPREDLIVGAGTVLEVSEVEAVAAAGGRFVVSPVTDVEVIAAAVNLGLVVIPGASTPTEMLLAHRAGAQLIKLFPPPAGGPSFLRAVRGPLPFLRIVPTSGVDGDNAGDWIAAGAFAVGFVGPLFVADDLKNERWDVLEERAAELLRSARGAAC